jgi:PAS domain S-box-containing protein
LIVFEGREMMDKKSIKESIENIMFSLFSGIWEMRLNPLTLSFSGNIERNFIEKYFNKSIKQIRFCMFMVIILFGILGILDAFLIPEMNNILLFLRYTIVFPFAVWIIFLSYSSHLKKYIQLSLAALMITAGLIVISKIVITPSPQSLSYSEGLVLVFMFGIFFRMRFIWTLLTCFIIISFYEAAAIWLSNTPAHILISESFFFICTSAVVMIFCYYIEYYARKDYFVSRLQGNDQEKVRSINYELEMKIEGRTSQLVKANNDLKKRIIERDRAEEQLRKLSKAVEQSPVSVMITDAKGNIEYVNPKFTKITGYTFQEVKGRNQKILRSDKTSPQKYEYLWDSINKDSSWHGEFHSKKKNGDLYWEDVKIGPITNSKDEITHFVALTEDITNRKRARKAIQETKELFKKIFAGQRDAIFILDKKNPPTILSCNPAAIKMFGYERIEVLGSTTKMLHIDEKYFEQFQEYLQEVISRQGFLNPSDFNMKRKDGAVFPAEYSVTPLEDENGQSVGWICIIRDITERRQLEEQFQQSQKMEAVGRLAGGVAHDFNNMITIIRGYSQLILAEMDKNNPIHKSILQIDKAGERTELLTRQLLAFSRKQILQPKILNLNELIPETEKMLLRLIGEDIELMTLLKSDIGNIKADPGQIEQVIMNLVINARDAMPKGGKLIIKTMNAVLDEAYVKVHPEAKPGRYVLISVSDTGIGMDSKTCSRIFEPFFTTKGKGQGTGLGLATVYGIVKQSGGHITVDSKPGQGTVFKIYLPSINEAATLKDESKTSDKNLNGSETILVVEDEENVRRVICETLRSHGYKLLEAPHGGNALLSCEQHKGEIDLMLTDVVMPEMSGGDLIDHLMSHYPQMKILCMSGYTDDTIVRHGILEEKVEFIQKPFTTVALAQRIRKVLDVH